MKTNIRWIPAAVAGLVLAGCATTPGVAELDELARGVARASFRDEGIVKADKVLEADETNRACSSADVAGRPLDEQAAARIAEANLKTIRWPSDGRFLGDWKSGEAIAQSGRGLTFTDTASVVNGGNCYNCHQITKQEVSFGTIGPSLYQYGRMRGVTDPRSPAARPIVEYTWGKIWNAKAYNACSVMPRAGHAGILTEAQVRDVVALLLDPDSPVNRD